MRSPDGVRAIATLEAAKGALVLIAGCGLLSLVHHDAQRLAGELVAQIVERAPGADGQRDARSLHRGDGRLHGRADRRSLILVENCAVEVENDEIKGSHRSRMVREGGGKCKARAAVRG